MKLEILNSKQKFENIKIFLNNTLILESVGTHQVEVIIDAPATVKVEFYPYKIQPIVRIDNFMLNYWLANILLFDHCLEFNISENFFQEYRDKDIQGRLNHIPKDQKTEHYFDKYIGLNNLYPDLVTEIKQLLNL